MLFNSYNFLIFFPIVTLIYFAIPHKIRHIWLLIASYFFYMCWNAKYALILLFSTFITYISGILISRADKNEHDEGKRKKKKAFRFCETPVNDFLYWKSLVTMLSSSSFLLRSRISTAAPVSSFCPRSLAGITLVLLRTRQSPGSR